VVHIIILWMNQFVERQDHDILYHCIVIFVIGWDIDLATLSIYSDCLFLIHSCNDTVHTGSSPQCCSLGLESVWGFKKRTDPVGSGEGNNRSKVLPPQKFCRLRTQDLVTRWASTHQLHQACPSFMFSNKIILWLHHSVELLVDVVLNLCMVN
jgi:hypothetical protein